MPFKSRRGRTTRIRQLVSIVGAAYSLALIGWHGLRFTPLGEWWPFELVDIFGAWLYAPIPLLVVASMTVRDGAAFLLSMVGVVLFAWDYGALFVPRATLPTGMPLRIMTANVLISNGDAAAIAATILEQDPDLVALQELGHDHAEYLAEHLRHRYRYQVLEPHGAPYGLGVFSRQPLHREAPAETIPNACACQRLSVEHAGRPVVLLNVHPAPPAVGYARLGRLPVPTSFRNGDTEDMLRRAFELLDDTTDPVIVVGDFNVGDRQPLYRRLRADFRDAHREAGWGFGFTFPNVSFEKAPPLPLVRIDYIFHDASWATRVARNGTIPGSDHRYVVAELVLR